MPDAVLCTHRTHRVSRRATLTATIASLAAGIVLTGVAAQPAAAETCLTISRWTSNSVRGSWSRSWRISSKSDCDNLYAAYAHRYRDRVRGWYRQSGTWQPGTRGFVYVPKTDNNWRILLSAIKNGSTVRGQTWNYNQRIQYVW